MPSWLSQWSMNLRGHEFEPLLGKEIIFEKMSQGVQLLEGKLIQQG